MNLDNILNSSVIEKIAISLLVLLQLLIISNAFSREPGQPYHNQMWGVVDAGEENPSNITFFGDGVSACHASAARRTWVEYETRGVACGYTATGGITTQGGQDLCLGINWCQYQDRREESDVTPIAQLIAYKCPALDIHGQCVFQEQPGVPDCHNDPKCDAPQCSVGNPIYPSTGMKIQIEEDGTFRHQNTLLKITRTYTHIPKLQTAPDKGYWVHDWVGRKMNLSVLTEAKKTWHDVNEADCPSSNMSAGCRDHYDISTVHYKVARFYRPDGEEWTFHANVNNKNEILGEWSSHSYPRSWIGLEVRESQTLWFLKLQDGTKEYYGNDGRLLFIENDKGKVTLDYESVSPTLTRIKVSSRSDSIEFYLDDQNRITQSKDVMGMPYFYTYNSLGLITTVTRPDNTTRIYHYEDSRFPTALTGITDERGKRYATWAYDAQGRAISSEHAGGADKTLLTFNADGSTTVTNALNKKTIYRFDDIAGARRVVKVEGQPTANCAGANQDYTYTAEGWVASKTDWKGIKTTYQYNAIGQEISRTEAYGTAEARTIFTEWHPTLYLKTKVTEPTQETTFNYDANGRLLNQSVRALTN